MWVFLVVVASNPPGTIRNVTRFSGVACADPTPYDAVGVCFSAVHQRPSTHCRRRDVSCEGTQQQVVGSMNVSGTGFCTMYEWTWVCAHERRKSCGNHWCDEISTCLDDDYCACPENMTGDPHWQRCQCPPGHTLNGSSCVTLPVCKDEITTSTTEEPSENCDDKPCEGLDVVVFAFSLISGMLCAAFLGYQWAICAQTPSPAVAPVRHHSNLMYQSARPRARSPSP
jgi:hypothetical protein